MRPTQAPGGQPDGAPAPRRPPHGSGPGSPGVPGSPGSPGNLPAELNRFVGRTAEAEALFAALSATPDTAPDAAARLVTVTGMGGVGKSRLARHTALRLQDRFCDGVWLVELSALRDGGLLGHTVAEALGRAGGSLDPPRSALLRQLADHEALLVLDGCEHLVDECAELAGALLRQCPGLRLLVTSRRPLEIAGERVLVLPPMPGPEAAELFAERASALLPEPPEPDGAVADLCRRLDGIPLAVELAAGRLRVLSVRQIADRLEDRFHLLAGNSRSALPRHQTLRTAIGWSHELCSERERLLWARLSVFAGDFGLEAVEYLCSDESLPADRVLPVLDELVAQSVVVRERHTDTEGRARYRLLDTVREYGAGWLEALGEAEVRRRRHRDWYLGLATWCELDWFGPRQAEVAARVERDLPNLRLALEQSLRSPEDACTGQYLAATLWFYWVGCGRLAEGQHWLDRALEWEGEHPQTRAKALWVAGLISLVRGRVVPALAVLQECLDLSGLAGDPAAAAYARQMLGALAVTNGDLSRSKSLLRDALERFDALGELNTLVILAQVQLALAHAFDGEPDTALALGEKARDTSQDAGERWVLSYALYVLACAHSVRGDRARAYELSVECLRIKREFHDLFGMTLALEQLAPPAVEREPEWAARLLGAAEAGWRTAGSRRFVSRPFEGTARECRARLRAVLGEERFGAAFARGRELGLLGTVERVVSGASRQSGEARGALPDGDGRERDGSGGDGVRTGAAGRPPARQGARTRQPAVPPPTAGAEGGQAG